MRKHLYLGKGCLPPAQSSHPVCLAASLPVLLSEGGGLANPQQSAMLTLGPAESAARHECWGGQLASACILG